MTRRSPKYSLYYRKRRPKNQRQSRNSSFQSGPSQDRIWSRKSSSFRASLMTPTWNSNLIFWLPQKQSCKEWPRKTSINKEWSWTRRSLTKSTQKQRKNNYINVPEPGGPAAAGAFSSELISQPVNPLGKPKATLELIYNFIKPKESWDKISIKIANSLIRINIIKIIIIIINGLGRQQLLENPGASQIGREGVPWHPHRIQQWGVHQNHQRNLP